MDVRFSIQAELELEETGDAIAADNPSAALRFIRDIRQHCERIATAPLATLPALSWARRFAAASTSVI
jgi:plasmid stabilization system protein ParE